METEKENKVIYKLVVYSYYTDERLGELKLTEENLAKIIKEKLEEHLYKVYLYKIEEIK